MKKLFLIALAAVVSLCATAKTTYIQSSFTGVSIEDGETFVRDSTFTHQISVSAVDERFSIVVLHDTITAERVKAIKRQKAAIALSVIGGAAGAVASVTSAVQTPLTPMDAKWQAINYTNGLALVGSSTYLAVSAKNNIDELTLLPITIIIQNNTDREMYVNDMARGLIWYIRAYGELALEVGNPEVNRLRIAYADTTEPKPSYVVVEACNSIETLSVDYEDKDFYYYNWRENYVGSQMITSVVKRNKATGEKEILRMDKKQVQEFKNAHK